MILTFYWGILNLDPTLGLCWASILELLGAGKENTSLQNLQQIFSSFGCLCFLNLDLKFNTCKYYGNYLHFEALCAFDFFSGGFSEGEILTRPWNFYNPMFDLIPGFALVVRSSYAVVKQERSQRVKFSSLGFIS